MFESNSTKSCIDKKIPRIITFLKSQKNKGRPKLNNGGAWRVKGLIESRESGFLDSGNKSWQDGFTLIHYEENIVAVKSGAVGQWGRGARLIDTNIFAARSHDALVNSAKGNYCIHNSFEIKIKKRKPTFISTKGWRLPVSRIYQQWAPDSQLGRYSHSERRRRTL